MNIVISQPMFIPWIGLFEQLRLSDIFVHYDDVQLPQGRSFISRVQIKTNVDMAWLTVPIDRKKSGKLINQTIINGDEAWKKSHLERIKQNYRHSEFFREMFELAEEIYSFEIDNLSLFNINAIEVIANWFGFKTKFYKSSELLIGGTSSERLAAICSHFNATTYITGLGALNYLDYSIFENKNIAVNYMNYKKLEYKQLFGEFVPFVTILDAIANCGDDAKQLICSESIYWKEYVNE